MESRCRSSGCKSSSTILRLTSREAFTVWMKNPEVLYVKHAVGGVWMKPNGTLKTIHAASEHISMILPFLNLKQEAKSIHCTFIVAMESKAALWWAVRWIKLSSVETRPRPHVQQTPNRSVALRVADAKKKSLRPSHHSELDHQMIIWNENQAQLLLIRRRTIDSRGGTRDGRESREFWTRLKPRRKQTQARINGPVQAARRPKGPFPKCESRIVSLQLVTKTGQ